MANWFGGSVGSGGGARSWQNSLDSFKNQVSSSLREVVDAVAVDPSTLDSENDHADNSEQQKPDASILSSNVDVR